jgi:cyclopropane fatty-acyl-phospholipid synthase-like methyltransferase
MSLYTIVKKIYRFLLPINVREQVRFSQNPLMLTINRYLDQVKASLEKLAENDELYDQDFFEFVDMTMGKSAITIADSIIREFQPKSAIDIGCGSGILLMELQQRGLDCQGLEYAESALKKCRERGLNVKSFNLEIPQIVTETFDIAVSTEVAEHLPSNCADSYVDLLTSVSNTVLITAATPGQGGKDHVNEQPNEYWIEKFCNRGFLYQQNLSMKLRQEWKEKEIVSWYYANVMIFTKSPNS